MHKERQAHHLTRSDRLSRLSRLPGRIARNDTARLVGVIILMILGVQLAGLAVIWHYPPPANTVATFGSIEHAGDTMLYRACVREARLHDLPVKPYPQESERISFVREGRQLVQQLELLEADVNDMSVENGCKVNLRRRVKTDAASLDRMQYNAPGDFQQHIHPTATRSALPNDKPAITGSDAGVEAPRCDLQRDPGLRRHYMLLNLCVVGRTAAESSSAEPGKKSAQPLRRKNT